ncbi:glycosyltransferase [candidate division WOR-3 bacterium]|nr:glycosyltransferase [candidate division WOR-3 bacterium]
MSNIRLLRRLVSYQPVSWHPRVSILIPARNESETIGRCIASLLAQDYSDFEVLVLDDHSEDGTGRVLAEFADPRLRVLNGKPLPDGWTGKTWACQQLADAATGELLLFTDADTVFRADTVTQTVYAMAQTGADLITALIRNYVPTLGEKTTVPFLFWSIISILPLGIAYRWRTSQALVAANGKFMLFRKLSYQLIGGHKEVRTEAAEDIALARRIKKAGMRWRMIDASDCVSTRMYEGLISELKGFSKNFFAIFDYRLIPALFVWCWMLLITWHPLLEVGIGVSRADFNGQFYAAVVTVLLAVIIWTIVALKTKLPSKIILFYPLTMTIASGLGFASILLTILGKTSWKGRMLPRCRVKIL